MSASPLTLRDQVLRGEIPDAFRNSVKPILGEDGQVWLVTEADAILHRYAADGSLIWSKALIAPEIQQSQQQFIQAWDEYAPGRGVPEPQPVRAAAAIGNELWLSLGEAREGGSVVAIHDADTGELRRRLVLNVASPMGPFAVDRLHGYLYFVLVEEASLLRARLP